MIRRSRSRAFMKTLNGQPAANRQRPSFQTYRCPDRITPASAGPKRFGREEAYCAPVFAYPRGFGSGSARMSPVLAISKGFRREPAVFSPVWCPPFQNRRNVAFPGPGFVLPEHRPLKTSLHCIGKTATTSILPDSSGYV